MVEINEYSQETSLRVSLDMASPGSHTVAVEPSPSPALHPKCLQVAPFTGMVALTISGASSHPRLTPTHHPFCQERFLLPLGAMKSDSFKCPWLGLHPQP